MISHPAFPPEPWDIRETGLDLGVLAQSESVFALSNGHVGLRWRATNRSSRPTTAGPSG
ncbi:hypothetical protein AB0J72_23960 [Dactylosporangium sp. NPDC049742]|uniref:hypothetical protein n=1 Tax=Dactylosporangium sp. NPDC049742 TaxID=3154737 RepID=UPI0034305045